MAYHCLGLGLRHARTLSWAPPPLSNGKTQTPLRDGAAVCAPARRQECANSGLLGGVPWSRVALKAVMSSACSGG
jgi:hypothetical protein